MLLHHHYVLSTEYSAHEQERLQPGLFILLVMSTTARPAVIIKDSVYRGTNESLKYKDVELFQVWDLEAPSE